MKKLILLFLLVGCGMEHKHQGKIAEVPNEVDITVTHKVEFDGITEFCELQNVNTQDCIESMTSIFVHLLDSSQNADIQSGISN